MKILIPTCKEQFKPEEMYTDCEVFASRTNASASINRNLCLDQIENGETAIMIDDDIRGFYPGWVDDLLYAFAIPDVVMVSARLLNIAGKFGPTCALCQQATPEEIVVRRMPTAAIAFVHKGHRFDEGYIGSGFEDDDWVSQYLTADINSVFIQSNRCKLIHANEMKNQKGPNWDYNKNLFRTKWPNGIPIPKCSGEIPIPKSDYASAR